jgi:hypothetical protein
MAVKCNCMAELEEMEQTRARLAAKRDEIARRATSATR